MQMTTDVENTQRYGRQLIPVLLLRSLCVLSPLRAETLPVETEARQVAEGSLGPPSDVVLYLLMGLPLCSELSFSSSFEYLFEMLC